MLLKQYEKTVSLDTTDQFATQIDRKLIAVVWILIEPIIRSSDRRLFADDIYGTS